MKLLFFILPFFVLSQEQIAKGLVIDKVTNEPIPYVNISILDSQIGTSSDDDGSYELTIQAEDFDKTIKISALAYIDKSLLVSDFLKLNRIVLEPSVEELDEVNITNKFENKFFEIQPFQKDDLYGGFGMGKRPWQIGLYFPHDSIYYQTEYIKDITVLLSKGLGFKRKASKFRVRLFSMSKDSLPDKDLINESIVLEASKKQKAVTVDVSKYDIVFPEHGLFVVLEGLAIPFNLYERSYTLIDINGEKSKVKKEIAYVPSFKAFLGDQEEFLVVHYFNGRWWNYPISQKEKKKYFVPAISLTLSN